MMMRPEERMQMIAALRGGQGGARGVGPGNMPQAPMQGGLMHNPSGSVGHGSQQPIGPGSSFDPREVSSMSPGAGAMASILRRGMEGYNAATGQRTERAAGGVSDAGGSKWGQVAKGAISGGAMGGIPGAALGGLYGAAQGGALSDVWNGVKKIFKF